MGYICFKHDIMYLSSIAGTRVTKGISYDTYERIADARNVRTANIPTTTYDASGVPTTTYERIAPGVPTIRVARTPPAPPPRQHAAGEWGPITHWWTLWDVALKKKEFSYLCFHKHNKRAILFMYYIIFRNFIWISRA